MLLPLFAKSEEGRLQNNGESEASEVPAKPVIKKKRLIWDIQIDPDDADMAGASEEAIKMMTQSRRVRNLLTTLSASAAVCPAACDVLVVFQADTRFALILTYDLLLPFTNMLAGVVT